MIKPMMMSVDNHHYGIDDYDPLDWRNGPSIGRRDDEFKVSIELACDQEGLVELHQLFLEWRERHDNNHTSRAIMIDDGVRKFEGRKF
jgi:hypothetical protein